MYENDELLYTQEDMDEWMRTCDELQEHLKEQEEQIKYLKDLCDKERLKTTELQQQIREEKAVFDMYRANTIQKGIADPEVTKTIRKQVCDMARKKIVEATCYDTEVEVRNVIYDLNASAVLEILDQIEKDKENGI